jgi:hypothetical protein
MTTTAYHQYCNIPFQSGSYASNPVIGPIQHAYPGIVRMVDNGVQAGLHPNPPKYGVADGSADYAMGKNYYLRTRTTEHNMNVGTVDHSNNHPTRVYVAGLQKSFLLSQSTKYNAPKDAGQFIAARKAAAIGQSSFKVGLPINAPLAYKSYDNNLVKTHLQRARNNGCTAPKKKSSIFNPYTSNCHYGAIPRSTY